MRIILTKCGYLILLLPMENLINKITQGDCLEVMKHIDDKSVDMILTDPPYGIDYQSARRTDKTLWKPKIANDKTPFVAWTDEAFRILKNKSAILCFTRWDIEQEFRKALSKSGFICKQQIIWDKEIHGMGDLTGDFASQHENIIFATKGRFVFKGKRPKSIFRTRRVLPNELIHPNEKPITLLQDLIESISIPNDTVLDMFSGSGTTAIAAIRTGRNFIGIEQEPKYVEIANKRIEEENQNKSLFNLDIAKAI